MHEKSITQFQKWPTFFWTNQKVQSCPLNWAPVCLWWACGALQWFHWKNLSLEKGAYRLWCEEIWTYLNTKMSFQFMLSEVAWFTMQCKSTDTVQCPRNNSWVLYNYWSFNPVWMFLWVSVRLQTLIRSCFFLFFFIREWWHRGWEQVLIITVH